jgi:hypothetical protein
VRCSGEKGRDTGRGERRGGKQGQQQPRPLTALDLLQDSAQHAVQTAMFCSQPQLDRSLYITSVHSNLSGAWNVEISGSCRRRPLRMRTPLSANPCRSQLCLFHRFLFAHRNVPPSVGVGTSVVLHDCARIVAPVTQLRAGVQRFVRREAVRGALRALRRREEGAVALCSVRVRVSRLGGRGRAGQRSSYQQARRGVQTVAGRECCSFACFRCCSCGRGSRDARSRRCAPQQCERCFARCVHSIHLSG